MWHKMINESPCLFSCLLLAPYLFRGTKCVALGMPVVLELFFLPANKVKTWLYCGNGKSEHLFSPMALFVA